MVEQLSQDIVLGTSVPGEIAEIVASKKLKEPALPFDSIVMDGRPYSYGHGSPKIFPTVAEDTAERKNIVGQYWGHQGTLEYLNTKGEYVIARDVPQNRQALRDAGYEYTDRVGTQFCNGMGPEGKDLERFRKIHNTPHTEEERMEWATRKGDLEQFYLAIKNGADVSKVKGGNREHAVEMLIAQASHTNKIPMLTMLLGDTPISEIREGTFEGSMLHAAARSYINNRDLIPVLLAKGLSPLERDNQGTPVCLATQNHKIEEFKLLGEAALKQSGMTEERQKALRLQLDAVQPIYEPVAEQDERNPEVMQAKNDAFTKRDILKKAWKLAGGSTASDSLQALDHTAALTATLQDKKNAGKFIDIVSAIHENKINGVKDVLEEFTNHVLIPQALLEHSKRTGQVLDEEFLRQLDTKALGEQLKPVAFNLLFKDRPLDKIVSLSEAWHDTAVTFPDQLKPLRANGEWHSLTGEKTHVVEPLADKKIYIEVLTSDDELRREGKLMTHCVGGGNYTTRALRGETHLFSVRQEGADKPLSTIEAKWDGRQFNIVQNHAVENAAAPTDAKIAAEWFKGEIEARRIPTSRALGETENSKLSNQRPEIIKAVGFEITQENVNAAFHEYANNPKRKGREWDPEKKQFDPKAISRRMEFIAGGVNVPEYKDGEAVLKRDGSPKLMTVSNKDLPADQWVDLNGNKAQLMDAIQPIFDKAHAHCVEQQAQRDAVAAEARAQQQKIEQEQAKKLEAYRHSTPFDGDICPQSASKLEAIKGKMADIFLGELPKSLSQQVSIKPKRGGGIDL